eukprot:4152614-Amphidinium_carterae.1
MLIDNTSSPDLVLALDRKRTSIAVRAKDIVLRQRNTESFRDNMDIRRSRCARRTVPSKPLEMPAELNS